MTNDKSLGQFKLPRWGDLPPIDLYLDQVLSLVETWLGDYMNFDGHKVMTKTMINNYVKQKFIRPPVNKRYDKTSVASLFVISILKSVYTINEISQLINIAMDASNPEKSYNYFCDALEEAVSHAFNGTSMPKEYTSQDPRDLFWNVCNSFACQLYVRNIYLQSSPKDDNLLED